MIKFTKDDVSIIMANSDYGVCYEPIIAVDDKSTIGYEAPSRFKLKNSIILPDVSLKDSQIDFWINLLKSQRNIVVEIIENSDEESVNDISNFMDCM